MSTALVWFRNDLRLEDNEALVSAVKDGHRILPVYVWDEGQFENTEYGFPRIGDYRIRFIQECLDELNVSLASLGGGLIVRSGHVPTVLTALAEEVNAEVIYCSKAYTTYEKDHEQALQENGVILHGFHTSTLIHPEDIPFQLDRLPDVFTSFRKKVEKYSNVRDTFPAPTEIDFAPSLDSLKSESLRLEGQAVEDDRATIIFKGGSKAAKERIRHYFWNTKSLASYKETRNGLIGADYSSKLSPWLASGSISARQVYAEVRAFEKEVKKNQSTYWLIFELLWRDYFQYVAMQYGDQLFWPNGIKGESPVDWNFNPERFEKWKNGETGQDFVDANMRELLLTGFMSNRGRQNVASFLTKDLKIDWRAGAAWFEHLLIDHDPCSNYGNWQYVAGVGNDPRENRYFNLEKQAERYDPESAYRDLWLAH